MPKKSSSPDTIKLDADSFGQRYRAAISPLVADALQEIGREVAADVLRQRKATRVRAILDEIFSDVETRDELVRQFNRRSRRL